MSYIAIATDCAGRPYDRPREISADTRKNAAEALFGYWPDEPGCTTRPTSRPLRDRCVDGALTPAGYDGIEYHSNPSIPPYGWCRPEGQTELRETYKRLYASLAVVL